MSQGPCSATGEIHLRCRLPAPALALVGFLLLLWIAPAHAGVLDLAWDAPTTNADGTPLTDLGQYRVYVGTAGTACPGPSFQQVPSPTPTPAAGDIVTTRVAGLLTGTTYIVQVTAVDTSWRESLCSNQASGVAKADADATPPSSSVVINNGAAYTSWTAVTLSLAATDNVGVTGYYVSTSSTPPAATATGWVPVGPTPSYSNSNVPYTLATGDGTKRVYTWYKDAAWNVSVTASATILLDQTPPSGGTLTATAGSGQVSLNWTGFSDSGSGLASTNTYKLVASTGSSPATTCTSGTQLYQGTGTNYTHTGLTSGTTYYYRVCAMDKAGNVSTGGAASATPQGADTTPPTVSITSPTTNATYSTSNSPLTLAGTAADNVGLTSVTWANSLGGNGTASGTTSWTAGITLQRGTNVLTVTAKDAAGNTATATLTVTYAPPDTTPPTAPSNVTATTLGSSQISLSWSASTDNVGIRGYRVERCQGVGCSSFSQIATPAGTSYGDSGLLASSSYSYRVRATDAAGNLSPYSTTVSATTQAAADTSPPKGTLTLNGGASTNSTTVTLALAATDNVGVTGYYLATTATPPVASASSWVSVGPTTSYTNSNVLYTLASGDGAKSLYAWYKDGAGNVSATASASILLDQTPPSNGTLNATAGTAQVTLSWTGFSDGGSGLASSNSYKLVFNTGGSPAASCTSGTQLFRGSATSFTHTGLTNGTTYFYRVCAFDNAGNVSTGATASGTPQGTDTTAPTVTITPPTTSASYSTSSSLFTLAGTASDNVGVTQVTWANSRGGSGTASGTTSWTASGIVLKRGNNVLTVTAKDAAGNTGTATLTVAGKASERTPPTVTITSPTTSASYSTSSSSSPKSTSEQSQGVAPDPTEVIDWILKKH